MCGSRERGNGSGHPSLPTLPLHPTGNGDTSMWSPGDISVTATLSRIVQRSVRKCAFGEVVLGINGGRVFRQGEISISAICMGKD